MEIKRGDIFFIRSYDNNQGSEQDSDRPAVIVSNNKCNTYSNVVEIVYLTTKPKKPMPTHVTVVCQRKSTALCEAVYSISIDRIGDFIKTATDEEMKEIDRALMVSLALDDDLDSADNEQQEQEKQAMLAHIEYLEKQVEDAKSDKDKIKELQLVIEDLKKKVADLNSEIDNLNFDCEVMETKLKEAKSATSPNAQVKIAHLEAERNTYKAMYEQLLNKILEK